MHRHTKSRTDQEGDEDTMSHSDGAPRWLQTKEDRLGELKADDKLWAQTLQPHTSFTRTMTRKHDRSASSAALRAASVPTVLGQDDRPAARQRSRASRGTYSRETRLAICPKETR